jgi:hypothetical protein
MKLEALMGRSPVPKKNLLVNRLNFYFLTYNFYFFIFYNGGNVKSRGLYLSISFGENFD